MAGDGVSLPTTLSQLGSVAKTQAKVQQPAHNGAPFSEQLENKDELKAQRVKETQETEQQKIKEDQDRRDRRQRRKQKRNSKLEAKQRNDNSQATDDSDESASKDAEKIGALIDLRV